MCGVDGCFNVRILISLKSNSNAVIGRTVCVCMCVCEHEVCMCVCEYEACMCQHETCVCMCVSI